MSKSNIFGLDISDHSIEAILIKKTFGRAKVASYARTVLRGDIVKDGVIKNPVRLAESIKRVLASAQPRPIRGPYCILSLPDSQVFTTVFKLPAGLSHQEIKNTIPYQAEEVIPFRSAEVYFDFKTIAKVGSTQEVFYAAVPTKTIDGYIEVLHGAGLVPVAFDLESISLARALINPSLIGEAKKSLPPTGKKLDSAILLMDIGARVTNLNIFDRNGIRQNISVKIAGNRFTKSLVTKLKITEKEANELKIKFGLDPAQKAGQLVLTLQKELDRLVKETKNLISYYEEESGRRVGLIILAGGSSLLPGLDKYFSDSFGLTVQIGNILAKVADPENLVKAKNKSVIFANAIGLGLRGVANNPAGDDINFLPLQRATFRFKPASADKKAWRLIYVRLAVLAVAAIVFGGLMILKSQGIDPYQKIYPIPEYKISVSPEINYEALDALRAQFLLPVSTSTPTSTPTIAEAGSKFDIVVKKTTLGYLNVRQGPGVNYPKVGSVNSGTTLEVIVEQDGWYEIKFKVADKETEGWLSAAYVDKVE